MKGWYIMKIKSIVALIFALTVTLILTSCNDKDVYEIQKHFLTEEEKAVKVIAMADKNMNAIDSYTAVLNGEFDITLNDKPMKMIFDMQTVYQGVDGSVVYNEKLSYSTEYDGEISIYETVSGFQHNRMYCRYSGDGVTSEMCSVIFAPEYEAYLNERASIDGTHLNVSDFENCSLEEENGGYKLVFSGILSFEQADKLSEAMDLSLISDYLFIEDINLTFLVSEDLYYEDMILEPVFKLTEEDDSISVPTMKMTTRYEKFNSSEAEILDIRSYKLVDDLRDLEKIAKDLRDLYKSEEIAFKYTGYKPTGDETAKEVQEIDVVDYSLKDGKPTYVIFSTIPDMKMETTITYSSGKKIVTAGNAANTLESDDRTEKQFVRSLMFPLGIDRTRVCDIKESEPGVYLLHFKASDEQEKQIAAQNKVKDVDVEFWISLTYEDGVIKKYTSQISMNYTKVISANATVSGTLYSGYEVDELNYKINK